MAVVGSGPAGFYTSYRVMSLINNAKIDMYEALPVPFGLVRFGVAPDHPEVKNCEDKFTEVASSPDFTFIGNVAVGHAPTHTGGQSVQLSSLLRHYDAVVFAYGASKDRALGIPGESLKRIYSAREFVGWYNGLPEFANLQPDLSHEQAVIIGQGNVALDVTRILLEDVDKLRETDIADYALEALSKSRVRDVRVVGRRGPMQAAFTIKELRELMQLPDTSFRDVEKGLIPPSLAQLERPRRRLMEVLAKGSKADSKSAAKSWSLDFCLSPSSFQPDDKDTLSVGQTTFQKTYLTDIHDPQAAVNAKGDTIDVKSPIVFRSIGYKSEPLPEFETLGVPFDERKGVIVSHGDHGRVAATVGEEPKGHFPGLYCAGWVKRGPTGVIASTMKDAFSTADAIAEDWKTNKRFLSSPNAIEGRNAESAGWDAVKSEGGGELAKCVVDWDGWLAIDRAEKGMGTAEGKRREKITAIEEMLPLAISKTS
ncbi:NADPH-adrenodoxin reductase [Gnomoniopsis smithogilvyi]|uniref:NADPH:adrenodoxin oxidoreductase, mitochondrial n=1 Tax=Gnomoniopsis smithogilvyi TaxID=1191159 RepID=A0A9W9CWI8_9PEZI|nr:NADPH-adrenodoxin reductase [Gnomoniopsis smithogilvyi]